MANNSLIRINLKTAGGDRDALINYCLKDDVNNQCVAIGWSYVYTDDGNLEVPKTFNLYEEYYNDVVRWSRIKKRRLNHALNVFKSVKEDDLFWTRDSSGFYWICRAKSPAKPKYIPKWDVGALVPVKAYQVGMDVPGQIKASFNRPNGGTVDNSFDDLMINYSKYVYNLYEPDEKDKFSDIEIKEGCVIDNLPPEELEELVISYIQIKKGYYLLSNSIARKSTTKLIEGELISRDKNNPRKAVVQVKAIKKIKPAEYADYLDKGYDVYFYDGGIVGDVPGYIYISKEDILAFYSEYKNNLPNSITSWEYLFKTTR